MATMEYENENGRYDGMYFSKRKRKPLPPLQSFTVMRLFDDFKI